MLRGLSTIFRENLLLVAFYLATVSLVSADQAQYIYDDLGRLVQVIDGRISARLSRRWWRRKGVGMTPFPLRSQAACSSNGFPVGRMLIAS
jgi:hypothetical protein